MKQLYYQLMIILRKPSNLLWTLAFPLFLGGLFFIMFSNLDELEQFSEISIGVVLEAEESAKTEAFLETLDKMETDKGVKFFEITKYTKEEADNALKNKDIKAYITVGDTYTMTAKNSGADVSVIKVFLDEYKQNEALIEKIATTQPERLNQLIASLFSTSISIKELPIKGQDKSVYTQYYFAVIAMTCLMASMLGLNVGKKNQANMSSIAARRNVAPTPKMKQVLIDAVATFIVYVGITIIMLAVFILIFKQDFTDHLGPIFLGALIGNYTGLSVGIFISAVMPGSESSKDGLCTTFFMVSAFLAGLQMADIVYRIEKSCPIINRINPGTLLVNGFKSLYVFDDVEQYAINMLTLFAIGTVFLIISILKMRRNKYASI